jgi:hypothetical protein
MQPRDAILKIDDISAARIGRQSVISATLEDAAFQLREFGLVILRNAFSVESISGLLDCVEKHTAFVHSKAIAGLSDFSFDETYRHNPKNLGCDLTAIDPWTAGGRSSDFAATSLYAAIMSSFVRSIWPPSLSSP